MSSFDDFVEDVEDASTDNQPKEQEKAVVNEQPAVVEETQPEPAAVEPQPTPAAPKQTASAGSGLTNYQVKDLELLAQKYDVEYSEVIKLYEEKNQDPSFQYIPDENQRFRSVKRLIENSLQKRGKLEKVNILVLGRHARFQTSSKSDWVGAISNVVGKVRNPKTKQMELIELQNIESHQGKQWEQVKGAYPLHSFDIHVSLVGENGDMQLHEYTTFKNGITPAEANEEKFGHMNDEELFTYFGGVSPVDSLDKVDLSETDKSGFPIITDMKAIQVIIEPPSKIKRAPTDEFGELYSWRAEGTDLTGNKIVLKFPPFPEFESIVPANRAAYPGVAYGPLSEYQSEAQMDVYHWIPKPNGFDNEE